MSVPTPPVDVVAAFADRQARLEERVTGLEGDLKTVLGAVTGLSDKMDCDRASLTAEISKRGQTNWVLVVAIVGAAMTAFAYLGSGMREPILARQDGLASDVRSLKEAVVPRTEVNGYQRTPRSPEVAFQDRLDDGTLVHKVELVPRPDGTKKSVTQVRVTPKGLTRLAVIFAPRLPGIG